MESGLDLSIRSLFKIRYVIACYIGQRDNGIGTRAAVGKAAAESGGQNAEQNYRKKALIHKNCPFGS